MQSGFHGPIVEVQTSWGKSVHVLIPTLSNLAGGLKILQSGHFLRFCAYRRLHGEYLVTASCCAASENNPLQHDDAISVYLCLSGIAVEHGRLIGRCIHSLPFLYSSTQRATYTDQTVFPLCNQINKQRSSINK